MITFNNYYAASATKLSSSLTELKPDKPAFAEGSTPIWAIFAASAVQAQNPGSGIEGLGQQVFV